MMKTVSYNEDCQCDLEGDNPELPDRSVVDFKVPEVSVIGDPAASVTIIEFSDFRCSHCKEASEILNSVVNTYRGKVKLVFMNYPLDQSCNKNIKVKFHEGACVLAKGAICASRQKRFSEYQEAAFAMGVKEGVTLDVRQIAILSGLDLPEFMGCLETPETGAELKKQITIAKEIYKISSTPVVFINGKRFEDWKNKDVILKMIDIELGKIRKKK